MTEGLAERPVRHYGAQVFQPAHGMTQVGNCAQQQSARLKNAGAFAQDRNRVVEVLQNAGGHDHVERSVPKRQRVPARV